MRTGIARVVLLALAAGLIGFGVTNGATPPTDAERLDALWAVCLRHQEPECLSLTASASPSPTAAPSSTPAPSTASPATPSSSPSAIATSTPTSTPPSPTTSPAPSSPPSSGSFIGPEVAGLPMTGAAWTALKTAADASAGSASLNTNQDNRTHPKVALAAGLVAARYLADKNVTAAAPYVAKVKTLVEQARASVSGTPTNGVLSLGRQLTAYLLAADYVGYRDAAFVSWVGSIRTATIGSHGRWKKLYGGGPSWDDGGTAEDSASNWGIFALASLTAADAYLRDTAGLDRDFAIWTSYGVRDGGNFQATQPFEEQYGAGWMCAPITFTNTSGRDKLPIAINLASCTDPKKEGAATEDAARTAFPTVGNYPAESAQGYVLIAELLRKSGRAAWTVNSNQACRNAAWRARMGNLNYSSADWHVPWVTNARCGRSDATQPAVFGRGWGFTDWLYG